MMKDHSWMRVSVPVCDLRKKNIPPPASYFKDLNQETQLLFNEKVIRHFEEGQWSYVEAIEQDKYYPESCEWQGYRGWVLTEALIESESIDSCKPTVCVGVPWAEIITQGSHRWPKSLWVSLGTTLSVLTISSGIASICLPDGEIGSMEAACLLQPSSNPRNIIVDTARQFFNTPYHWGGRSANWLGEEAFPILTGVDCSGLSQLSYKAAGISIPRDAIDQFRASQPIDGSQLQQGDLIFTAPINTPEKIDHVMICLGGNNIIEASMSFGKVREISFEEKFGISLVIRQVNLDRLESSEAINYFRSFFVRS